MREDICKKCGLPKDICMCENIMKEDQDIVIRTENRKYQKITTIISGLSAKDLNLSDIARSFKKTLACGGTVKNSSIELQGSHLKKVKDLLVSKGFSSNKIKFDNKDMKKESDIDGRKT